MTTWDDLAIEPLDSDPAFRLFSVDVEDWFHSNFVSAPRLDPSGLPRIVERGVTNILEALASAKSRATFFVLGSVAEEHPDLVPRIASRGHEIGCHGFDHTLVYEQSPSDLARDLARARELLQAQSGQQVLGFRAPSWSVTERSLWALDCIAGAGFTFDSSIHPAETYLYGMKRAPRHPYRVTTPSQRTLLEIPPATLELGPLRFGMGGGFYLRVLPAWVHSAALLGAEHRGHSFVAYTHPRELEPESWRHRLQLSAKEQFIHRVGLGAGARRARALIDRGGWRPMIDLLDAVT